MRSGHATKSTIPLYYSTLVTSNNDSAAATEIGFSKTVTRMENIAAISRLQVTVALEDSPAFHTRIQAGADLIDKVFADDIDALAQAAFVENHEVGRSYDDMNVALNGIPSKIS